MKELKLVCKKCGEEEVDTEMMFGLCPSCYEAEKLGEEYEAHIRMLNQKKLVDDFYGLITGKKRIYLIELSQK